MAYINGNLAMQPKRKPDQKTVVRETKRIVVKRKSIPVQEKLLYMFTVVFCVIVLGVIVNQYAKNYDMRVQIKQMKTQYATMNIDMKELQKQVEMLNDPERIRKMAETQGMASTEQPDIMVNTQSAKTE
ncbi:MULTISPECIES: cell division protein FtsL [unclassified Paenibacillus]|uniref:cell division protein FtsL n=1 Tax=unclassified Paenibacillus TaxID=185978 RepID=UPI0010519514|nr:MULTISPECIES: cell division protein FtsL [unclassified Paenibacillus]NIK68448.1 cell division protein FtsL [Paenibacillus sp. BK720]TCM99265.1 cell division protein FtsL [Paenibacillus sp. BK033]